MSLRKAAKGSISELYVGIHFIRKGWSLYVPYDHDQEHDLVVTKGPRIKRLQVKTVYACGDILRANVDHKSNPKYSPDTIDIMACFWYSTTTSDSKLWVIPMEDIEEETTLNFGKIDGSPSRTRGNFDHTRYLV
jgi:hypothetical protein